MERGCRKCCSLMNQRIYVRDFFQSVLSCSKRATHHFSALSWTKISYSFCPDKDFIFLASVSSPWPYIFPETLTSTVECCRPPCQQEVELAWCSVFPSRKSQSCSNELNSFLVLIGHFLNRWSLSAMINRVRKAMIYLERRLCCEYRTSIYILNLCLKTGGWHVGLCLTQSALQDNTSIHQQLVKLHDRHNTIFNNAELCKKKSCILLRVLVNNVHSEPPTKYKALLFLRTKYLVIVLSSYPVFL